MPLDETVQAAFDQAKQTVAEQSTPAVQDDTKPAATDAPDPATAEPTGDSSAAKSEAAPEPPKAPDADDDEKFISDKDLEGLSPEEMRRKMQAAYTQKTQRLAEGRKLLLALEKDPINTVRTLAKLANLPLVDPATQTKAEQKETRDEIEQKLTDALGEESAKAVLPLVREITQEIVNSKLSPIEQHIELEQARRAEVETNQVLEKFTEKRPDWKQHEAKMMEIAQYVVPRGLSEVDYMDKLYLLATAEIREAEAVKKAVSRVNSSVATAATSQPSSASPSKVSPTPQKGKNFDETLELAFKAAMRGERWAS